MRAVLVTLIVACLPAVALAAPPSDAVVGIWLNAAQTGYIQIYQTDSGAYAGQIVGATDGEVHIDTENPDPDQRGTPLLGQEIMHGFTYNGEGVWEEGHVYDPDNGETYEAWMALKSHDKLKLHGYIMFSFIGRTEIWTRVEDMPRHVVERVLVPSPARPGHPQ